MFSISFEKYTLSNGLDVILHEDHSLPVAAVDVWYHVGSKDEEPGRTGFAHLFEHVMFEGSKHHNRSYFDPLQKVGANLNGSTTTDRTNYWETVPSNYLELALWLESDRMGFLLEALDQRSFDVQRDVVKNERRQSHENRPYGMAHLLLQPAVFPSPHPYSWTTIGDPKDLDAASLDDVKAFFQRFYSPSNASLAIAGDIDVDGVKAMVDRYFGDLPPGPSITRVGRMDSDLRGEVNLTMRDRVQLPRLYLVWPTGPLFDEDQAPLDMLAIVLGDGKSSRLYRSLVYERQIARDVGIYHHAQAIAGEFHIQVTASPGNSLDEIEGLVMEELNRLHREPPSDSEIARARNRVESHHVHQLERIGGFGGRADQLNYYNIFTGDPGAINSDVERYMAVTAADVAGAAGVAQQASRVRLLVLPEESLSPAASGVDRTAMPSPSAPPSYSAPIPERGRLSNGLAIVLVEKRGLPVVSLGMTVRAGGLADSSDKPGLANMAAAMLDEGTTTRSSQQIAAEMEGFGAHLDTEASREYVLLWTETLTSHWHQALDIIADVVRNPTFPPEELERLRKERLIDLSRISDSPLTIAARASRALLYGPESRYGHPVNGTIDSISGLSRGELVDHFASHYAPEGATLIVVGDVAMADVTSAAEARLGDWSGSGRPRGDEAPSEVPPAMTTTLYLADKPGAPQSVIRTGLVTIPRHDPDFYVMTLLNYIFGGQFGARLNMNLRQDKGFSYGYTSSIDWAAGPSALFAGGSVQTAVTKEALTETLKEFRQIRGERPVTSEEFDDARDGILRGFPTQFETLSQTLHQLNRLVAFGLPDDYFVKFTDNLKAVTLADVNRAARERLDDQRLSVLVVGDAQVVEPGLKELGLPVVSVDHEGRPTGAR